MNPCYELFAQGREHRMRNAIISGDIASAGYVAQALDAAYLVRGVTLHSMSSPCTAITRTMEGFGCLSENQTLSNNT